MLHLWDPIAEMTRLHNSAVLGRRAASNETFRPAVDIREEAEAFLVHAELPGVKTEDVSVSVDKGLLTIRGERKFAVDEEERKTYRRVERFHGAFERTFSLPDDVDGSEVTASLRDGVLAVRIPKKAAPQPRKIAIAS